MVNKKVKKDVREVCSISSLEPLKGLNKCFTYNVHITSCIESNENTRQSVSAEVQVWTSTYVEKLKVFYSLRNNLCAEGSIENEQIPDVVKRISKLDKDLVAVENANSVAVRWTPNDEQYKAAMQIQVVAKCKQLIEKMKPLSQ